MCHPPLSHSHGVRRFPVHCTAPMGFGPSAGWAQELTDLATEKADLPGGNRVLITDEAPETFPVWGSIIDDIWAVAEEERAAGPCKEAQ